MTRTPAAHPTFPLDAADLCVKCGLCLPHCPTYTQTRHEGDSPRGRISLMQGLASGALPMSESLEAHLDGCLSCRACERVCPAKVPYGLLIDEGRALLAARRPERTRTTRAVGALLSSNAALRLLSVVLWLYRASGLQRLVRGTRILGRSRLARLESLVPRMRAAHRRARTDTPVIGRVSLFTGCVGRLLDEETLASAEQLFARMGYRADRPVGQTCCGAIRQHGGLPELAGENIERNLRAFADAQTVIHCASGCGATLIEYPRLARHGEAAQDFAARLEDLSAALLKRWPDDLQLHPLRARVALHLPCTQRNVVGGSENIVALLRKIPEIELIELDATHRCCGAAGLNFVTQPQMADALLEQKMANTDQLQPDYIVSTNIGCSLHLAGGLRRRGGAAPEVLHPATLLARHLP